MLPYWASRLVGALGAGLVLLAIFTPYLQAYEARERIVRGAAGSERSAMVFNQYFPHPLLAGSTVHLSPLGAVAVEALGTAILVLVIFALTDPDRAAVGPLAALWIGLTVAALICVFAPLTQAGGIPLGISGRGSWPMPLAGKASPCPVPRAASGSDLVGPLLGGSAGGWLYESLLVPRRSPHWEPSFLTEPTAELSATSNRTENC